LLLSLFWIVEACDDEKEDNNAEAETNLENHPVAGQTGGDDLLRLKLNGQFVSLYPGVNSSKVKKALNDGGLIWEK
jgi:hypothetical protein